MAINHEDLSRLQEELGGLVISGGEEASEVVVQEEPGIESPLEHSEVNDAEESDASDSTAGSPSLTEVGSSSWTEGTTTWVGSVSSFEDTDSHFAGSEPEDDEPEDDEPFTRVCPHHHHPPYSLHKRYTTKRYNDLRNDGRDYAKCPTCADEFLGFVDQRGVNEINPLCDCEPPRRSRMSLGRIDRSGPPFKIFYNCANPTKNCEYYKEPGEITVGDRTIGCLLGLDDRDWLVDEGWV